MLPGARPVLVRFQVADPGPLAPLEVFGKLKSYLIGIKVIDIIAAAMVPRSRRP